LIKEKGLRMKYQHKETKQVKTYRELNVDVYKDMSLPKDGTSEILDYTLIEPTLKPKYDRLTQGVKELDPVNGKQTWLVYQLADNEVQNNLERKMKKDIIKAEDAITNYIQDAINDYNTTHGVAFKDIDALQKYTVMPEYTHYKFCIDMLAWNVQVWEAARQIQIEIFSGQRAPIDPSENIVRYLPTPPTGE
jgi:hypothetical protein